MFLLVAAAVSGAVHFLSQSTGIENWDLGAQLGWPDYMNGIWYLSLLSIGVGYIAGKGGKTGYLVGATPRMQQMGQFLGAWLGPILVVALIFILK